MLCPIKFLAVSTSGLFLINGEKNIVKKILDGNTFGITFRKNKWYCYFNNNIIYFTVNEEKIENVQEILNNCPAGIHQIDFIGDDLFIADTPNNRLLIYKNITNNTDYNNYSYAIYPNNMEDKMGQINYLHLNAFCRYKDVVYILAHNRFDKTQKMSEIYKMSMKDYSMQNNFKINGRSCHNIFVDNNKILFLNSHDGQVILNNDVMFKSDRFLRGLSVADDYYIVGGNSFEPIRADRLFLESTIFIFDKKFNLINSLDIPECVVDVKRMDRADYTIDAHRNVYS